MTNGPDSPASLRHLGEFGSEARKARGAGDAVKVAARSIVKRFGSIVAADDISLDIRTGEFLTLLGESGCGKTTLMRIIAGLETVDSGVVSIDDVDVTHLPPRRRNVGMVFQQYSLFPHMTVAENISYGLQVKRRPPAEIDAAVEQMLALVRLPELRDRRPTQLSGGQQQRIALARALATRPTLLMLDEPLGALDLKLRRQLQAELKRIHRETSATFLFVTHDQDEALFLSDRVAVMRAGRIEQLDDPVRIYRNPANRFVADFVGDVSLLDGDYDAQRGGISMGDDGFASVELAGGSRALTLVVRPENVILTIPGTRQQTLPAPGVGGLSGRLQDVTYQSGTTLYTVRLQSGLLLKSRSLGAPSPGFRVGAVIEAFLTDCHVAFER